MENESKLRACKQCGKMVDFSESYCPHETMEESAWQNMSPNDVKAGPKYIVLTEQDLDEIAYIKALYRIGSPPVGRQRLILAMAKEIHELQERMR